ncbi:hypothetical protein EIN_131370 [Entamoeba invadens IP1]|uniref:Leucine rich repeat containing protein BspA family protein n=1 Tax=Entamoeba invadens IP1 TaxID=370355 RepID=A0A0A1UGZ4_ENTIV|nr:hypothetical protein EIN_131370 [Entamoeba invadens IP1]ELP94328.1 hypothetical protein EIN_131370 [Entamoeba invadens IP1]|eukprot:XP_004261099.1 hypothetical protein EIN_131370 [Entamoeba invadens IP1]
MTQLDRYHIVVVSKYFLSIKDFTNFVRVSRKFKDVLLQFHINPIPINKKTIKYFPKIETLNLWCKEDEHFGNVISNSTQFKHEEKKNSLLMDFINIFNSFIINTKTDFKMNFFRVNIWYEVSYELVQNNLNTQFIFKNITYTEHDQQVYGYSIPLSVSIIDNNCFQSCNKMISIIIPNSVTSLKDECFSGCVSLTSISLSNNINTIGKYSFVNCTSLKAVTLPVRIKTIEEGMFENCSCLISFNIPSDVSILEKWCFRCCRSLRSIDIPINVKVLSDFCFENCISLFSVKMFGVTQIGNYCFQNCVNLSKIDLKNSLKVIGDFCFRGCEKLLSLDIPKGVQTGEEWFDKTPLHVIFKSKGCDTV